MPKKLTNDEYIEKAKEVFPEYDYSKTNYISAYDKVKIVCPKCGEQDIKATYLVSGRGCSCFPNRYIARRIYKKPEIEKINEKFPNFEIFWDTFKSSMEPVKIKCKVCNNIFERMYNNLKSKKCGCPWCAGEYKTLKMVLEQLKEKYGEEIFDFSLMTNYSNNREIHKIICKKCGKIFESDIHELLLSKGRKCPYCNPYESLGERAIRLYLEHKGFKRGKDFIKEYKIKECKDILPLPFDFYLPDYNMLIEYQGEQHYEKRFGGRTDLEKIQRHDRIKKKYALSNGFHFLEIPYWELKNIGEILDENIEKKCW